MPTAERPLRADAERNRRRILDAAARVLASRGLGAGVDEIAREAGVGVGTLYRRFPTKEALVDAILEDRVERTLAALEEAGRDPDPWQALRAALISLAERTVADRALKSALEAGQDPRCTWQEMRMRCAAALAPLLHAAQRAGAVRDDIVATDLLLLLASVSRLPEWRLQAEPELWRRYADLLLDGLRAEGAHPLGHPPPAA